MVHRKTTSFEDDRRRSQQPYLQIVDDGHLGAGDPYNGIGADLRAARVRHGYSLQEVSSRLRIQLDYLEAIEAGQFEALPGPAYAIGFLRSYANALGVDGEDVVLRFKSESAVDPGQTKLVFPTPVQEARRPGAAVVAASLAVAVAGYVGWAYWQQESRLPVELVPEPPQRLATVLDQLDQPQTPTVPSTGSWSVSQPASGASAATPADGGGDAAETMAEAPQSAEAAAQAVAVAAEAERDAAATQASDVEVTGRDAENAADPADEIPATDIAIADSSAADTAAAEEAVAENTASNAPVAGGDSRDQVVANAEVAAETPEPAAEPEDEGIRPELPATTSFSTLPSVASASMPDNAAADDTPAVDADVPEQPAFDTAVVLPEPPVLPAAPDVEAPAPDVDGPPSIPASVTATEGYVPQVFGSANRNARVVVRAKADAWVQVQGANNELLLTRILRAGDTYMAPDRSDLTLMTGNAGALEAIVDGALVGALGPEGQVRRDISLDADKLLGAASGSG